MKFTLDSGAFAPTRAHKTGAGSANITIGSKNLVMEGSCITVTFLT